MHTSQQNLSFADYWSIRWLSESKHIMDVPTDKQLGVCIVSSVEYDRFMKHRLEEAFCEIDQVAFNSCVQLEKAHISEAVSFALDLKLVDAKIGTYLECLHSGFRVPLLRQLIKVHKPTVSTRLISSGTSWFTNPASCYIAVSLQPIINKLGSVARDTGDVLKALDQIDCLKPCRIRTFDVEKLYPSMCQERVYGAIRRL